jgi:hypothetical protein
VEHLDHFGLARDPFSNEPQLALWFESAGHAAAEQRLRRALRQGKGLCVLLGEGGSGKTLLVRHLLESLEEDLFEACMLVPVPGVSDGHWILDRFARQLGVEEPADTSAALLGQIYERLAIVREDGRHTVLVLDEAQVLAEQGVLRELRGLLNLEYEDRRLRSCSWGSRRSARRWRRIGPSRTASRRAWSCRPSTRRWPASTWRTACAPPGGTPPSSRRPPWTRSSRPRRGTRAA